MSLIYEPSKTTHWKNLHPSKMMLLGSQNLNEGEELIAKIKTITVQGIKNQQGQDESVPVAEFYNAPPMVLNITNCRAIACLYGELYDRWAEKSIQIYATKVKAFGSEVLALRVREAIPETGQDLAAWETKLKDATTLPELQTAFMAIPKHIKSQLIGVKDEMKEVLSENN